MASPVICIHFYVLPLLIFTLSTNIIPSRAALLHELHPTLSSHSHSSIHQPLNATISSVQPYTFTLTINSALSNDSIHPHPLAAYQSRSRVIDAVPANSVPAPWMDRSGLCLPQTTANILNRTHSLCNPSGLLSTRREQILNDKLAAIYVGRSPYSLVDCSSHEREITGFRVGILLVGRMKQNDGSAGNRAKHYVKEVFENWELDTNCRAAVLVFVSWEDKQMYIKTGALAAKYVTEQRINDIFSAMRMYLAGGHIFQALSTAVDSIGGFLQQYHSNVYNNPPSPANPPPMPPSPSPQPEEKNVPTSWTAPLFRKGGPNWWVLGMLLVLMAAGLCIVCACCHGMGGPEASQLKKEKHELLRKLSVVRTEYIRATLPDYAPSTCSISQKELHPSTTATSSSSTDHNQHDTGKSSGQDHHNSHDSTQHHPTESDPLVSPSPHHQSSNSASSSSATPASNIHDQDDSVKTFRCGHAFFMSQLRTLPEYSANPYKCPVCGDTPGVDDHPKSLSETRGDDYSFRLSKLQEDYPHLLTPDVYSRIHVLSPTHWPDTLDESFIKPAQATTQGTASNNNWVGNVGGALAAGGLGAIIGSALAGGGGSGHRGGGGGGQGDRDGGHGSGFGGNQAAWFGQQNTAGGDGGHGASFGGGPASWFGQQSTSGGGGGGHGAGWGAAGNSIAGAMGGWMGGSGGGGGGGGGHGGGGGGGGGGGHGGGF